jgi:hypothetical protein
LNLVVRYSVRLAIPSPIPLPAAVPHTLGRSILQWY